MGRAAGLTQLNTFPHHLAECLSPSPSLLPFPLTYLFTLHKCHVRKCRFAQMSLCTNVTLHKCRFTQMSLCAKVASCKCRFAQMSWRPKSSFSKLSLKCLTISDLIEGLSMERSDEVNRKLRTFYDSCMDVETIRDQCYKYF